MASQSVQLTESIQFPATQTVQPSKKESDQSPEPPPEEVAPVACSESWPPSEVILTCREFEEIQDCS